MPNPINLNKTTYIYGLIDPKNNNLKYIGKTVKPLSKRLTDHIYEIKRENNKRTKWIKSLIKKNLKPDIIEIDICSFKESKIKEMYWIDRCSKNNNLLNKHYNEV